MYTDYTVGSYSVRKMVPIGYIYSIVCTIMHVWVVLQKCCSAKNTVGRENFAVKTILRSRPTTKKKKKKKLRCEGQCVTRFGTVSCYVTL